MTPIQTTQTDRMATSDTFPSLPFWVEDFRPFGGLRHVYTVWQPDEEERAAIAAGGGVEVALAVADGHPPISVVAVTLDRPANG